MLIVSRRRQLGDDLVNNPADLASRRMNLRANQCALRCKDGGASPARSSRLITAATRLRGERGGAAGDIAYRPVRTIVTMESAFDLKCSRPGPIFRAMKFILPALSISCALGLVMRASGVSLALPEVSAIVLSAGLTGWVIVSNRWVPQPLVRSRCLPRRAVEVDNSSEQPFGLRELKAVRPAWRAADWRQQCRVGGGCGALSSGRAKRPR